MSQKFNQIAQDQIASINYHNQIQNTMCGDFKNTEKTLNQLHKQLEALETSQTLSIDHKKQLRSYYQGKINQCKDRLAIFLEPIKLTLTAINIKVNNPEFV